MFQVIGKQNLNKQVRRLDIKADALVAKLRPGQFVAVMPDVFSRFVPMNVYEVDFRRRCLSLVFAERDAETVKLGKMRINDQLFAVHGPFGHPIQAEKVGTVVFVGEGHDIASIAQLCRNFKQAGNKVIGLAGYAGRDSSVLENQLRLNCTKFYVMYKDGAHERRGDVLIPLQKVLAGEKPAVIYAHTTPAMMKSVRQMAEVFDVKLFVNVMGLLEARPSFKETDPLLIRGDSFLPARDGVWMDAAALDLDIFVKQIDALKEYDQCRRNEAELLASKNVWARLKKFVWG